MLKWQQQRQIILAIALGSVVFSLLRLSTDSTVGKRSLAAFTFPQTVPLPGWQMLESQTIKAVSDGATNSYNAVLASQKYHYRNRERLLEIEMRYMASNSGDLENYLMRHTAIKLKAGQLLQNIRQHQGVGYYSLFTEKGRSHLAACINPQGSSTVTREQFLANRYTYDLQPQRMMSVFLGKASLLDNRCLWVNLSILIDGDATSAYPVLEQAWWSWYRWWSDRFPQQ
jgi:cyanosortase A-associated protein